MTSPRADSLTALNMGHNMSCILLFSSDFLFLTFFTVAPVSHDLRAVVNCSINCRGSNARQHESHSTDTSTGVQWPQWQRKDSKCGAGVAAGRGQRAVGAAGACLEWPLGLGARCGLGAQSRPATLHHRQLWPGWQVTQTTHLPTFHLQYNAMQCNAGETMEITAWMGGNARG